MLLEIEEAMEAAGAKIDSWYEAMRLRPLTWNEFMTLGKAQNEVVALLRRQDEILDKLSAPNSRLLRRTDPAMPTTTDNQTREEELTEQFHAIEAKYTEDGITLLGNATPDELRELGKLNRELTELRAPRPEEVTA